MAIKKVKQKLLELLADGSWVNGQRVADETGCSRTYIWKAVNSLRRDGFAIESAQNRGYRLEKGADVMSEELIRRFLPAGMKDINIVLRDTLGSTNDLGRLFAESGCPDWTVVIAREQTAGRGRFDRRFFSPAGTGLYMSVVLRPAIAAKDSVLLTAAAAVAVAKTLEKVCRIKTGIKWVNDVYVNGKKVCGILAESSVTPGAECPNYIVLGIGINLLPPKGGFPDELKDIAAAATDGENKVIVCRVAADLLARLKKYCECLSYRGFYEDYEKRCFVIGREIEFERGGRKITATAERISRDFELVIRLPDGRTESLNSGEISVKPR
ncbi:MAG: biotin--[acetyl-CoA-carboxylase] ligase [Clostridia bacterium]|nr:biotin--[acetyl-CoA-carboxylase] ligase [Clostridia bacterium]